MQKPVLFFALTFSFQILFGQDTRQESIVVIKSLRKASNEFISKHNAAGLSVNYMEDFVLIRGNGSHLTGRDTVMALWKEMFQSNPGVSFERIPAEINIDEQNLMAWETGTWTGINTYSKGGNYSAMWRNTGGTWRLQAELFVALK